MKSLFAEEASGKEKKYLRVHMDRAVGKFVDEVKYGSGVVFVPEKPDR